MISEEDLQDLVEDGGLHLSSSEKQSMAAELQRYRMDVPSLIKATVEWRKDAERLASVLEDVLDAYILWGWNNSAVGFATEDEYAEYLKLYRALAEHNSLLEKKEEKVGEEGGKMMQEERINPNDDLWCALEYNPHSEFDTEEIIEIVAEVPGENDEFDWWWLLKLKGNKYILVSGGCDYTGWDCQSSIQEYKICDTALQAILFAPTKEECSGRLIFDNLYKQITGEYPKYTYWGGRE